ncbi:diacylglycerol/lipid kinase family protein [Hufsiella arboris]|uniref:diacylglycerol/lipid kinase family protein n=1 Tax=Hufsiella arboris TaxID=2695275 RepID=UPI0019257DF2|nr:diacylglycerol kinase family protein [Hufsiella arboris]
MKKRVLFIINPISGGNNKSGFLKKLNRHLDLNKFDAHCVFTEYKNHAYKVAKDHVASSDIIVAVGGDGTVNEVASALKDTDVLLGIIPSGSGNGLARTLNIPLDHKKAIERINTGRSLKIDCGELNGRSFFNMAGLGFDAHISALFDRGGKRGFFGYAKSIINEISSYKSKEYFLRINDREYCKKAFMLSIANSSQYGNNAHVAPEASVNDGLLDVCIIKPFSVWWFPVMIWHLFSKTANRSRYVEIIQGKDILIKREQMAPVHLDGEPLYEGLQINILVKPLCLSILV